MLSKVALTQNFVNKIQKHIQPFKVNKQHFSVHYVVLALESVWIPEASDVLNEKYFTMALNIYFVLTVSKERKLTYFV